MQGENCTLTYCLKHFQLKYYLNKLSQLTMNLHTNRKKKASRFVHNSRWTISPLKLSEAHNMEIFRLEENIYYAPKFTKPEEANVDASWALILDPSTRKSVTQSYSQPFKESPLSNIYCRRESTSTGRFSIWVSVSEAANFRIDTL